MKPVFNPTLLTVLAAAILPAPSLADEATGTLAAKVFVESCIENWDRPLVALAIYKTMFPDDGTYEIYLDESGPDLYVDGHVGMSINSGGSELWNDEFQVYVAENAVCFVSFNANANSPEYPYDDGTIETFEETLLAAIRQIDGEANYSVESGYPWAFKLGDMTASIGSYNEGCCTPVYFLDIPDSPEN